MPFEVQDGRMEVSTTFFLYVINPMRFLDFQRINLKDFSDEE